MISGAPGTDEAPVAYAPRRIVLDKLLVDAAAASGAEVREGFTVEEVLLDADRVVGVRGHAKGGQSVTERARVVVGADGLHSLVAKAVQPEQYHEKPALLCGYYSYWSGLPMHGRFENYISPNRGWAAFPTHDDLTLVVVGGEGGPAPLGSGVILEPAVHLQAAPVGVVARTTGLLLVEALAALPAGHEGVEPVRPDRDPGALVDAAPSLGVPADPHDSGPSSVQHLVDRETLSGPLPRTRRRLDEHVVEDRGAGRRDRGARPSRGRLDHAPAEVERVHSIGRASGRGHLVQQPPPRAARPRPAAG